MVDAAYHMAGATAVFSANKFERRFRDMHAIAQQIQARDTHYEDVGRMILATEPRTADRTNLRHLIRGSTPSDLSRGCTRFGAIAGSISLPIPRRCAGSTAA